MNDGMVGDNNAGRRNQSSDLIFKVWLTVVSEEKKILTVPGQMRLLTRHASASSNMTTVAYLQQKLTNGIL